MKYKNGFLTVIIICAFFFFISASDAKAQSPTFTVSGYALLGNTHTAADFNGDGKQDLAGTGLNAASVMLNNGDNAASVMLNNGDGTFRAKVDYPAAGQTQDTAAGDFNGDGKMDLVITINTPQISLSLLMGNGYKFVVFNFC